MTMTVYANDSERYPCDDDILAAAPENPVRFLADSELAWKAMVDGIEDLERLEAYRQAEKRHIERENPSDKVDVHKYIDARERELTGSVSELTHDASADPVPATDGGEVLEYDENDVDGANELDPETNDTDPAPIHPDANGLEAGQVLVIEFANATEHAWPQTADAADPYILRTADGERTLTQAALFDHIQPADTDRRDAAAIDVDAPATAATGGDA